MDAVWIVLTLGVFGLAGWWAYRSDPHWASKDGLAFTCRIQLLGQHLLPDGRWRDCRAFIDDRRIVVRSRGLVRARRATAYYEVVRRADDPPKQYAIWVVDGGGVNDHDFAVLRIPARSRAVPEIDAIMQLPADRRP